MAVVRLGLLAPSAGAAVAARRERTRAAGPASAAPGPVERLLSRRLAPWRLLSLCGLALALARATRPRPTGRRRRHSPAVRPLREARLRGRLGRRLPASALRNWSLSSPQFWGAFCWACCAYRARPAATVCCAASAVCCCRCSSRSTSSSTTPSANRGSGAARSLLTLLFTVPRLDRPRAFRVIAATLMATVLLVFPYSDYFRYS
ncbi:hypothetical protein LT493_12340 [Streptomyces tricolor]|nr:hypothetical protein [Streptomyces tricolor]